MGLNREVDLMKMFFYSFIALLVITNLTTNCIDAADKSKMLLNLDIIKNSFEVKYAPVEWKKKYSGWDLEEEINLAKLKIIAAGPLTVKEYQRILHAFFISTRDYHVHDLYYSTEMAILPFVVKGVGGKYFITEVDEEALQLMKNSGFYSGDIDPQVGDELISFDSKITHNVIEEIKIKELGNSESKTAQVLAEPLLTKRLGLLGHEIPKDRIKITFKPKGKDPVTVVMQWVYLPEKITNKFKNELSVNIYPFETSAHGAHTAYSKMMVNPLFEVLANDYSSVYRKALKHQLATSINPPNPQPNHRPKKRECIELGTKIWEEEVRSPFHAYIYESPETQKKIGYIRIKTFHPSDDFEEINNQVRDLAAILNHFERATDALVIDAVDNPGGFVLYVYTIASLLTDRPLVVPTHRLTITQEEVAESLNTINKLENELAQDAKATEMESVYVLGFPCNQDFKRGLINYHQFIVSEWSSGKTFTNAYAMYGLTHLRPHPLAQFSKPILMLVNSNDFSGGDFFPAILQDNKRAVIFGETTAGAGGIVQMHRFPNLFGLKGFTYTASFAERIDGRPLENLGVQPDVPYELTEDDLLNGYKGYIQAVNEAVEDLF